MCIKNIVLIGAGNLGSRHLQALANVENLINIQIMDLSEKSLAVAKERFAQMSSNVNIKQVSFFQNINELNDNIDIAIIATNSNVRKEIVEYLITHKTVRYLILEKVVFQSYEDFVYIKKILDFYKVKAWVNCPRRMLSFYQRVQQELAKAKFIDLTVKGSQWGLGCNALHMIDLYAFISNQAEIKFDIEELDNGWIASKRKGFCEFTGTLRGKSCLGKIELTSYQISNMPFMVEIVGDKIRYIIFEAEGRSLVARDVDNWQWREEEFYLKYQSQLTNIVVDDLLVKGTCALTSYEESMLIHRGLLAAFLNHMNKTNGECLKQCPIT